VRVTTPGFYASPGAYAALRGASSAIRFLLENERDWFSGVGMTTTACGAIRVTSDCRFRNTGTEYDRKPGIKWLSCTEKRQSDITLGAIWIACELYGREEETATIEFTQAHVRAANPRGPRPSITH
jgi:hypothetical protein